MKRFAVIASALLFVGSLAAAMLELAPAAIDLRGPVAAHLAASGVSHPVTAVLLNYRGYDTKPQTAKRTTTQQRENRQAVTQRQEKRVSQPAQQRSGVYPENNI